MSTDSFAHDDAAYVLGALSPEDRAAFEAHLSECDDCANRVAELGPVADSLAVLNGMDGIEAALLTTATEPVPDTLLPILLRSVRAEQRRRRRVVNSLLGVAAAAVLALSGVLIWPSVHHTGGHGLAMSATVASPVHATATLSSVSWGTKIELACHYDAAYASGVAYKLVVIDKQGGAHDAGDWLLTPGRTTHFTGGTSLDRSQIAKVQIDAGSEPILQLNL